ncbi:MAG: hypothetical protein EZS28_033075 [Streblomastix strix]|uniref:Uncharacterized protein n=1 Tax=Streblomastix strix TaxID=222440 RepID=A0A5J4ULM1_9EUKA|nr:MAG: hypothetical protein EZS28_033075 [Streblomastix strix]
MIVGHFKNQKRKDVTQNQLHQQITVEQGLILETEFCQLRTTIPAICHRATVSTFVNAFRQNIEIDPLDRDQTIVIPEEILQNAITAAWTLLAEFSGQETSHIDFYAKELSEEQVVDA